MDSVVTDHDSPGKKNKILAFFMQDDNTGQWSDMAEMAKFSSGS
jgi:hypothetical protein